MKIPREEQIKNELGSIILDTNGKQLAHIFTAGRGEYIPLSQIPIDFLQLLFLAEDQRFYSHHGADGVAIGRAFLQNLLNQKIISGASTITQQLARIKYQYPRKWFAKPLVILHAFKIELFLSKGQILEYYLNNVNFSHAQIGIANAARFYFNKSLQELNLSEKSILVTLIRSPSFLSSDNGAKRLFKSKNHLLNKYFNHVNLSKREKDLFLSAKISFLKRQRSNTAHHFVNFLQKTHDLENDTIVTTLNLDLQNEVQYIVSKQIADLNNKDVTNGAAIVIDNSNGDVLAYVGSYNYFDEGFGQIDAVQTPRQPGSTLKPFTYSLALQNGWSGWSLSSILPDVPLYFNGGNGSYRPRNYSSKYLGPVSMRKALGNSLNIPAIFMADTLGVTNLFNFLKTFDLNLSENPEYYGVGLTLGNAELTLWEVTTAFTAFTHEGQIIKPRLLAATPIELKKTALKKETADLINNVLSDNFARSTNFGTNNIFNTPYHLAVKTGTSTLFRDNWTIGYNAKYTVGVWVGNMDQKPMHNVSGVTGAGPILVSIFDSLMKNRKSRPFNLSNKLLKKNICVNSGKLATEHCPLIKNEYFLPTMNMDPCNEHYLVVVNSCNQENDIEKIPVYKYSEFFRSWAERQKIYTEVDQVKIVCRRDDFKIISSDNINSTNSNFRIASPIPGSIYGKDPNIPEKYQKLYFQVLGNEKIKSITWILNNQKIYEGIGSNFFWEIQKGSYDLMAEIILSTGERIKKSTYFTVL